MHIWQVRASRYALCVCRCDGTLEKQTSCHHTQSLVEAEQLPPCGALDVKASSRSLIRMPGRVQSASAFLNPTHILPASIAGETARVRQDACACVRGTCVLVCLYLKPVRRAVTRREVVTQRADMLWLFVKHERFRCETDVKVVETQKALNCEC